MAQVETRYRRERRLLNGRSAFAIWISAAGWEDDSWGEFVGRPSTRPSTRRPRLFYLSAAFRRASTIEQYGMEIAVKQFRTGAPEGILTYVQEDFRVLPGWGESWIPIALADDYRRRLRVGQ